MSASQSWHGNRVERGVGSLGAQNACKRYIICISNWDLLPSGTHSWRQRGGSGAAARMRHYLGANYFRCFFCQAFFDEKIKDPYKDVRSAALEVIANNWKSLYNAEIYCCQFSHRFATKSIKAYTMLRWTALKFVAAPRKGTVLDPGFSIGIGLEIEAFLCQKIREV